MSVKRKMPASPLLVIAGALGIFLAPWFVPNRRVAYSASYILGFNNTVATLALAALLGALFLRLWRRPAEGAYHVERILRSLLQPSETSPGPRSLAVAFGATMTLTVLFLLFWYLALPFIDYGEIGSDVSRLDQMVLGLKPYRDFQYNYGPAMLYPAYWLYGLAGGRISIDAAYCANLLAHWTAGLCLALYTVRSLCQGQRRTVVFLSIALAVFNLSLGVGYTPLRFITPLASLLFLRRRFGTWVDRGTAGPWRVVALAALLSLCGLSLSPEIGVATAAGITAFFAALFFTPLRYYSLVALVPPLTLGLVLVLWSPNYAESLLSHGSGANNFPVFPTPHILLLVAASTLLLPRLGLIGVRERTQTGALALALVVGLGLMLAGAFGRCDPGHILFNGLGVLVLFLVVAVLLPGKAAAPLLVGAFLVVHPALGAYYLFQQQEPFIQQPLRFRRLLPRSALGANEQRWLAAAGGSGNLRYGKLWPFRDDLRQLLRFDSLGTPFDPGEDIERFLKLSGRFVPEYYAGKNMQLYTPSAVDRKIRDLQGASYILLPSDHQSYPIVVSEHRPESLSALLFFPAKLIPRPRQRIYIPGLEVLKRIEADFTVIGRFRDLEIWRRNGLNAAAPSRSSVAGIPADGTETIVPAPAMAPGRSEAARPGRTPP